MFMKVITYRNYGSPDVLKLEEMEKPIPRENELLLKLYATAVNSGDCRMRKPDPQLIRLVFGLRKPRNPILGVVFAAKVESVGAKVTKFKVGDLVYGMTGMNFGTYMEYKCISESATIDIIPPTLSPYDAAAIPFGTMTAFHFLKKSKLKSNERILIYGASGSVGIAAVQLSKILGAHVTAVCSKKNDAFVKSYGAHQVIHYDQNNFQLEKNAYDVIFDTLGLLPIIEFLNALQHEGRLILCNATAKQMLWSAWQNITSKQKIFFGVSSEALENLKEISTMLNEKKIQAVIDKTYSLEETADAHRYVDVGHKKGNVIIKIS